MKLPVYLLSAVIGLFSPVALAADEDAESVQSYLSAHPDLLFCAVYKIDPNDRLHAELAARKLMTDADWIAVSKKDVREGSSECAALAVYGIPSSIGDKAFNNGSTIYTYPHFPKGKDPAGGFSVKDGVVDGFVEEIIVH